ncbi:MAG: hypothetical protein K2Y40_04680 [Reyranella sp.]|nr:hypothetical protein [Reyranella sp.]
MAKLGKLVFSAVAPLLIAACTQTASGPPPGLTAAQGLAYCTTLATLYSEYVGNTGSDLGTTYTGGEDADLSARYAIAACEDGDTGAGIPILQKRLRDAKVAVPPGPAG